MHAFDTTFDHHPQAAARANCCKLLAACFYPPDADLFLEEKIGEKLAANLETACPEALCVVPWIENHLGPEDGLALSVAYTRLFLGPPKALAPPYASFYLDQNQRVMGPSSAAIMRVYDTQGLRMDDTFTELPDHVAVMLEFLCYLFSREAAACHPDDRQALQEIQQAVFSFGDTFLTPWIPRFCRLITAADEHPYYTDLARTLEVFLQNTFTLDRYGRGT